MRVFLILLGATCAVGSGCKSGSSVTLGDSCASDDDCSDTEVCDLATEECVETMAGADSGGGDASNSDDAGDNSDAGADAGAQTDAAGADATADAGALDASASVCGDRTLTPPETCDDGNTSNGDGCDDSCQREPSPTCGDGNLDLPFEECDDGNTAAADGCDGQCRVEVTRACGDGNLDLATGEECDDGGNVSGDGCSSTCQFETVGAFCGDGSMDPTELCDDNNTSNGDGCNPTCNLTGTVTTFAGMAGAPGSQDGQGSAARLRAGVLATDDRYIWFGENGNCMNGTRARLRRIEESTGNVTTVTQWNGCFVEGIATDGAGTVWVASNDISTGDSAIWAIDTTAPMVRPAFVAGNSPCSMASCYRDDSGTQPATFGGIRGLTWWAGLLYIVDPAAGVIRSLDPTTNAVLNVAGDPFNNGIVDGVGAAARFQSPRYIVSDGSGMLYVSETNNGTIRAVNAQTRRVSTFAGNGTAGYVDATGSAARSHRPRGITSDGTSVYWVEFNAHSIRQGILGSADVSTLAGMVRLCPPGCGGSGLGCRNGVCLPPSSGPPVGGGTTDGVGTNAELFAPFSIAFHYPSNSLFVIGGSNTIRRIQ